MMTFETKSIGNDLFEVTVDGKKRPIPYTLEQVAELYEILWKEDENENKVQT